MICENGTTECTGCMRCRKEPENYRCPVCGRECDTVYKDLNGEIFGCDRCVKTADVNDKILFNI